jgi:hypothetical protein
MTGFDRLIIVYGDDQDETGGSTELSCVADAVSSTCLRESEKVYIRSPLQFPCPPIQVDHKYNSTCERNPDNCYRNVHFRGTTFATWFLRHHRQPNLPARKSIVQ